MHQAICVFSGKTQNEDIFTFKPGHEVDEYINKILKATSSSKNFTVYAANVNHAMAALKDNKRVLLYDQYIFASLDKDSSGRWVSIGILAHQIGHLVRSHTFSTNEKIRRNEENEADTFAATALYSMGASLDEALAFIRTIKNNHEIVAPLDKNSRIEFLKKVWTKNRQESMQYGSSVDEEIPLFPWPPPKASCSVEIPSSMLVKKDTTTRLADIAAALDAAFHNAGYVERTYYAAWDGFAIVSRLEQINPTGEPKEEDSRWAEVTPPKVFSLSSYLKALFTSQAGHYRIIVFVVTPHAFSYGNETITFKVSKDWLWGGMNKLPPSIGIEPFTDNYTCTALIYEFVQLSPDENAFLKLPSPIPGKTHLEKAKIWQILGN